MSETASAEDIVSLKQLINRLQEQIAWGLVHFEIWKSFDKALAQHLRHTTTWFFSATLWANFDLALLNAARMVDKHKDSATIFHLLSKVEQMISRKSFVLPNPQEITDAIAQHRGRLDNLKSRIEIIRAVRDTIIAHMDKKYAADPLQAYSDYGLNMPDVEMLYTALAEIVSYYATQFDGLLWDLAEPAKQVRPEVEQILKSMSDD